MGRRKIFHTDEERLEANRSRSIKSYKKNREQINERRRTVYATQSQLKKEKKLQNTPNTLREQNQVPCSAPFNPTARALETWMERAQFVQRRLRALIGSDEKLFLENLCINFIASNDKDPIHDVVIALSKLQKLIYKYSDKIYELSGVGEKFREVTEIVSAVKKMVTWVEELFCHAMVDVEDVIELYEAHTLEYQK